MAIRDTPGHFGSLSLAAMDGRAAYPRRTHWTDLSVTILFTSR
jgi:hypothetical protein